MTIKFNIFAWCIRNQSCRCSEEVATCFCTWPWQLATWELATCNWRLAARKAATCCRIDNFAGHEQPTVAVVAVAVAAVAFAVAAAAAAVAVVNCQCFFLFFYFFVAPLSPKACLVYANCNEFPWPSSSSSSKWAFDFNRAEFAAFSHTRIEYLPPICCPPALVSTNGSSSWFPLLSSPKACFSY